MNYQNWLVSRCHLFREDEGLNKALGSSSLVRRPGYHNYTFTTPSSWVLNDYSCARDLGYQRGKIYIKKHMLEHNGGSGLLQFNWGTPRITPERTCLIWFRLLLFSPYTWLSNAWGTRTSTVVVVKFGPWLPLLRKEFQKRVKSS